MRGALPGVAFKQLRHRVQQEREEQAIGLGEIEPSLESNVRQPPAHRARIPGPTSVSMPDETCSPQRRRCVTAAMKGMSLASVSLRDQRALAAPDRLSRRSAPHRRRRAAKLARSCRARSTASAVGRKLARCPQCAWPGSPGRAARSGVPRRHPALVPRQPARRGHHPADRPAPQRAFQAGLGRLTPSAAR